MKKHTRDLWLLFALALIVRFLAAWPQQQPNYMDASYSYVNALNLAAGRGFVEDFVWNYLADPPPPPHPSHLYWMPLTSILAWLGMLIGGVSYHAAQIPFVILSALLAPLTYGLTSSLSGRRWQGWLAGLFAIFSGFYFPFWTAIDNFTPFAVTGAVALLAAWKGLDHQRRALSSDLSDKSGQPTIFAYAFIAGIFVALAHLARADGPLLLITIGLLSLFVLQRDKQVMLGHTLYVIRFAFFAGLGYTLGMLPWFLRNWQVAGILLPAAGSHDHLAD